MSKLETNTIDTVSGTSTLQVGSTNTSTITLGVSGDTINVPSGVTIANSGTATGFGGDNTPFFLANVTSAQTVASGTSTKVTGFADIYDTSNTFASDKFTPAVAGYYYLEGSVSINTPNNSTYLQSQIYKNGSLIAWSQQILGSGNTALVTASIIDLADDNDYYEMYIRQNSGGDIGTNTSTTAKYNRFLGYKLIT